MVKGKVVVKTTRGFNDLKKKMVYQQLEDTYGDKKNGFINI